MKVAATFLVLVALSLLGSPSLLAQNPTGARAAAPNDFTGYWVSIVTENWRFRMLLPDKNDYIKIPLNAAGRKIADGWDPAKDQASGNACKGYGAPSLLQIPGRLHIYWQDDNTLRLDTDSGKQTRLFHFAGSPAPNEAPSLQGYSAASWGGGDVRDRRETQGGPVTDKEGNLIPGQRMQADYLKVVTAHLRPAYLQKNGIPYGANALVEEDFETFSDPYTHNTWLVVTTVVKDPEYLNETMIRHSHFKKLPDNSGWDPTECNANEAR